MALKVERDNYADLRADAFAVVEYRGERAWVKFRGTKAECEDYAQGVVNDRRTFEREGR